MKCPFILDVPRRNPDLHAASPNKSLSPKKRYSLGCPPQFVTSKRNLMKRQFMPRQAERYLPMHCG